jgi:hypothetical protein
MSDQSPQVKTSEVMASSPPVPFGASPRGPAISPDRPPTPPVLVGDSFTWLARSPDGGIMDSETFSATNQQHHGECEVHVAESDLVPDKICDLLAEYLTDTICRIDPEAVVDLSVTMKSDLFVVTGEVTCSHPAKSAIVHSEHFVTIQNMSFI